MSKALMLFAVLAVSSLVMVGCAFAQSIPKPTVPEFSLKLVANPYDVPPTYEIDPYTGERVLTQDGYHVENRSIEITIRNQPFTIYEMDNGLNSYLFYNISYRGHYETDWSYYSYDRNTEWFFSQSDSEYTVISFYGLPAEGSIDFRVQAQLGSFTYYYMPWKVYVFHGETSGWSDIQTISIPEIQDSSPEPTIPTSPSPFPTDYTGVGLSETEIIIGASIIVAIVIVGLGLLLYLIKRK